MSEKLPDRFSTLAAALIESVGKKVNVIGVITDSGGEPAMTRRGGETTKDRRTKPSLTFLLRLDAIICVGRPCFHSRTRSQSQHEDSILPATEGRAARNQHL